jgi:hypothetical protein
LSRLRFAVANRSGQQRYYTIDNCDDISDAHLTAGLVARRIRSKLVRTRGRVSRDARGLTSVPVVPFGDYTVTPFSRAPALKACAGMAYLIKCKVDGLDKAAFRLTFQVCE